MRLPRLTVRRMMIHVAILALVTAFLDQVVMPWARDRSDEFRELAQYHGSRDWMNYPKGNKGDIPKF